MRIKRKEVGIKMKLPKELKNRKNNITKNNLFRLFMSMK